MTPEASSWKANPNADTLRPSPLHLPARSYTSRPAFNLALNYLLPLLGPLAQLSKMDQGFCPQPVLGSLCYPISLMLAQSGSKEQWKREHSLLTLCLPEHPCDMAHTKDRSSSAVPLLISKGEETQVHAQSH